MCGIFGFVPDNNSSVPRRILSSTLKDLMVLSESRGKEASGLAILSDHDIDVLKSALSSGRLLHTRQFKEIESSISRSHEVRAVIGHSRLVTTGSQYDNDNNQPVTTDESVGIHNGIITNHDRIWTDFPEMTRRYQVDSEVIFSLINFFNKREMDLISATRTAFSIIEGAASIALIFTDIDVLLLATNNGSLYSISKKTNTPFIFASEKHILGRLIEKYSLKHYFDKEDINHLAANTGMLVNLRNLSTRRFLLAGKNDVVSDIPSVPAPRKIFSRQISGAAKPTNIVHQRVGLRSMDDESLKAIEKAKRQFPHDSTWQNSLRRCTQCILTETMPYIEFDDHGVCNYCRDYRKLQFFGHDQLDAVLSPHKNNNGEPDCVIGLSGGRDSMYSLHYIKAVLGMNPVAFTYDWGMVTDLARRNISRMCGKLGVENILISADINKKRENIRKNVTAWLKRPRLGMIPLFMAGDKQYFYHLKKVKDQLGVNVAIMGENMLERTDFKTGFAYVQPYRDAKHVYTLSATKKIKLAAYYGAQYLTNPAYINSSLFDTAFALTCYYFIDRSYINLYNYIPWVESEVVPLLMDEYKFELATDTHSTWRIGDGTASFYNYIYYNVAGFSEIEALRSNQIREGHISRDEALKLAAEENKPRYESINWYINIINLGIELVDVLEIVHNIPKIKPSIQ